MMKLSLLVLLGAFAPSTLMVANAFTSTLPAAVKTTTATTRKSSFSFHHRNTLKPMKPTSSTALNLWNPLSLIPATVSSWQAASAIVLTGYVHISQEQLDTNNVLRALDCKPFPISNNLKVWLFQASLLSLFWFLSYYIKFIRFPIIGLGLFHPIFDHVFVSQKLYTLRAGCFTAWALIIPVAWTLTLRTKLWLEFSTTTMIFGSIVGILVPTVFAFLGASQYEVYLSKKLDYTPMTRKMKLQTSISEREPL